MSFDSDSLMDFLHQIGNSVAGYLQQPTEVQPKECGSEEAFNFVKQATELESEMKKFARFSLNDRNILDAIKEGRIDEVRLLIKNDIVNMALDRASLHLPFTKFPKYLKHAPSRHQFVHKQLLEYTVTASLNQLQALPVLEIPFSNIMHFQNNGKIFSNNGLDHMADSLQVSVENFQCNIPSSFCMRMSGTSTKPAVFISMRKDFSNMYLFKWVRKNIFNTNSYKESFDFKERDESYKMDYYWLKYCPRTVNDFTKYVSQKTIDKKTYYIVERNIHTIIVIGYAETLYAHKNKKDTIDTNGDRYYYKLSEKKYNFVMAHLESALKPLCLNQQSVYIYPQCHETWDELIKNDIAFKIVQARAQKPKQTVNTETGNVTIDLGTEPTELENIKFNFKLIISFRII